MGKLWCLHLSRYGTFHTFIDNVSSYILFKLSFIEQLTSHMDNYDSDVVQFNSNKAFLCLIIKVST